LVETFLYWGASFAFRMLCYFAPAAYFLFHIRMVHASLGDAIAHFAPMLVAQVSITTWLGGGRMLPIIADIYQLLIAPEIITIVAYALFKPGEHEFKVTTKGIQHSGLNVQWGLLARFLILAFITILGVAKVFASDNSDLVEDGGALSLFWSWYNLAVLMLCCFVCLEQPRRRMDERFATTERAVLRIGGMLRAYDVTDISVGGLGLSGQISELVGSPATVIVGGVEVPAIIARKGANEFAISLLGAEARETMTRRVYSERYGRPLEYIRPSRVLVGIFHRVFR
jgi:cellulose synthase (UDP-forming)